MQDIACRSSEREQIPIWGCVLTARGFQPRSARAADAGPPTAGLAARRASALWASASLGEDADDVLGTRGGKPLGVGAALDEHELTGGIAHELVIREFHDLPP